ncbi:MAG: hypothetical protein AAFY60_02700 [Myxococcota bacterium]
MTALFVASVLSATATQWQVNPAPGLDAMLFLGALSGDTLVERRGLYRDEIAWAKARLSPDV